MVRALYYRGGKSGEGHAIWPKVGAVSSTSADHRAAAVGASGGIAIADFEIPELLIAALFEGVIIGMAVEQFLATMSKQAWREKNRWRSEETRWNERAVLGPWLKTPAAEPLRPVDAADQLRIVMRSKFTIQPLLNKRGARVGFAFVT